MQALGLAKRGLLAPLEQEVAMGAVALVLELSLQWVLALPALWEVAPLSQLPGQLMELLQFDWGFQLLGMVPLQQVDWPFEYQASPLATEQWCQAFHT